MYMNTAEKTTVTLLLKRLYKWRKSILVGTAIAFILTCIVALILPEYYKARTSFYTASQDLASPESIFGLSNDKTKYFGTNEDEDRIMAIAQSRSMLDFIIDSFDLYTYYDIDPEGSQAHYKIYNKVQKRFDVSRSENDEMHLEFIDKSPEFTARVVNAATYKLQELGIQDIKKSQKGMIANYESFLTSKSSQLDRLRDSLAALKTKFNIVEPIAQGKALATSLANAQSEIVVVKAKLQVFKKYRRRDSIQKYTTILSGLRHKIAIMESDTSNAAINISRFSNGSTQIIATQQAILELIESQNKTRKKLNYLRSTYESKIPAIHIIELAETPEVKFWPQRKLLVLGVTILVFFLLCFYALIKEGYGSIDWNEITHGSD